MSNRIKMADGRLIPNDNIKFFRVMTDQDRENIKEKFGTDASAFNVQVTFTNKSQKSFTDEVAKDGDIWKINDVPLVNIGGNKFVVADEINDCKQLTKAQIEKSGVSTERTFNSVVELKSGGTVWSSGHASQVLDRRDKATGRTPAPTTPA